MQTGQYVRLNVKWKFVHHAQNGFIFINLSNCHFKERNVFYACQMRYVLRKIGYERASTEIFVGLTYISCYSEF